MENDYRDLISRNIVQDMMEGVLAIRFDGTISYVNNAAEKILGRERAEMEGKKFATLFFGDEENDEFNQTVLDAIYDSDTVHEKLVPYFKGDKMAQLHVITSVLRNMGEKVGVVIVIGDVTELAELKIRSAEQTKRLLDSIVKTLSQAIDERSSYTANHTRNMVHIAEAFLSWLEATDHSWKFDEDRRRNFLMSVWLHDVGKLAVPLEIMDKASRLGPKLKDIESRFEKIDLLEELAVFKNQMPACEMEKRKQDRESFLAEIRRINCAGFVSDEALAFLESAKNVTFRDRDGAEHPLLTPEEILDISIRKGTLNDAERNIIQSHVTVTRRILKQIDFPEKYMDVAAWASEHHELLNGRGYPDHLVNEKIPREVRLLTILDIFEALTAKDRPYKKPMPIEKAFFVLHDMEKHGEVDGEILGWFEQSHAWDQLQL
jgi:PAS domain S-box-containing protein